MTEEWGPWIEHDGSGCPCVGCYVHVERFNGSFAFVIAGEECAKVGVSVNSHLSAWVWERPTPTGAKAYRIRKPRALQQLRELVENLPEGVDA